MGGATELEPVGAVGLVVFDVSTRRPGDAMAPTSRGAETPPPSSTLAGSGAALKAISIVRMPIATKPLVTVRRRQFELRRNRPPTKPSGSNLDDLPDTL